MPIKTVLLGHEPHERQVEELASAEHSHTNPEAPSGNVRSGHAGERTLGLVG
jgi:hypothetical protein